jgi:mannose-6-phosphate isomerase
MYPLFFKPIYKSTIWGGRNLEKIYNRSLPEGKVAESWEISCHGHDLSVILNGEFEGRTLDYLMKNYKHELLGKNSADYDKFPLLIKIIDACGRLSVQVHPDDDYAEKYEHDSGKTEMWYIAHAKENAELILGLIPGTTDKILKNNIDNNTVESCLNRIRVKEGDVIYIPSGTVHAILDGIVLIEIQQSSDVTYRVYDWNRVDDNGRGRPLHIDKAMDVINFDYKAGLNIPIKEYCGGYTVENLVLS